MAESIDTEALTAQLPALRAEADRWRAKEAEAHRKVVSLESIIMGIEGLDSTGGSAVAERVNPALSLLPTDETTATDGDGGPRGIAAVRRVMLEHPDRVWRAKEIHTQLERRGWVSEAAQHPLRGTEAAINRLWKRQEIDRVGPGRYRASERMRREPDDD